MYTYYTTPLHDYTVSEIVNGDAGEAESYTLSVPVYEDGDANNDIVGELDVTIVAPVGYQLTDADHARIDELLVDER